MARDIRDQTAYLRQRRAVIGAFGFFDRNRAVFSNFVHCFGDQFADGVIAVGRDHVPT